MMTNAHSGPSATHSGVPGGGPTPLASPLRIRSMSIVVPIAPTSDSRPPTLTQTTGSAAERMPNTDGSMKFPHAA